MHPSTHSVMFHHFHDDIHPSGQGALSAEDLASMLDWLEERYSLLNADEYQYKAENQCLADTDICLSFDDTLLCQYEIAFPEIRRRNLTAFFFVHSAPIKGEVDYLEIFRYFRTICYGDIQDFYSAFFELSDSVFPELLKHAKQVYDPGTYLEKFIFYTANDKWFRFLRDCILAQEDYEALMFHLIQEKDFDVEGSKSKLWMNEKHIKDLHNNGNVIGLHSYSHPTRIDILGSAAQEKEYKRNLEHLRELTSGGITSMSHPCGRYNRDTLNVLVSLGVKIGFRSNMHVKNIVSLLEIPRENHANVYGEMKK